MRCRSNQELQVSGGDDYITGRETDPNDSIPKGPAIIAASVAKVGPEGNVNII